MEKIKNLYEIIKTRQALIKEHAENHDWEIGVQRYYFFLKEIFYGFLYDKISKKPLEELENFADLKLKIMRSKDHTEEGFIENFIVSNRMGKVEYRHQEVDDINTEEIIEIVFDDVTLDYILNCFYVELQMLEYYTRPPEEMAKELENFKNENTEWLSVQTKKTLTIKEEYLRFLQYLMECLDEYECAEDDSPVEISYDIDKKLAQKRQIPQFLDRIINFLSDYKLGSFEYDEDYEVIDVSFGLSYHEVRSACKKEIVRLETGQTMERVKDENTEWLSFQIQKESALRKEYLRFLQCLMNRLDFCERYEDGDPVRMQFAIDEKLAKKRQIPQFLDHIINFLNDYKLGSFEYDEESNSIDVFFGFSYHGVRSACKKEMARLEASPTIGRIKK